ncbi:MAG: hypothetical protein ACOCXI_11610, partial [Chloroflexota bacterium]
MRNGIDGIGCVGILLLLTLGISALGMLMRSPDEVSQAAEPPAGEGMGIVEPATDVPTQSPTATMTNTLAPPIVSTSTSSPTPPATATNTATPTNT